MPKIQFDWLAFCQFPPGKLQGNIFSSQVNQKSDTWHQGVCLYMLRNGSKYRQPIVLVHWHSLQAGGAEIWSVMFFSPIMINDRPMPWKMIGNFFNLFRKRISPYKIIWTEGQIEGPSSFRDMNQNSVSNLLKSFACRQQPHQSSGGAPVPMNREDPKSERLPKTKMSPLKIGPKKETRIPCSSIFRMLII